MSSKTGGRWRLITGFVCATALLLTIGVAVGIGVEHHRAAAARADQPTATDIGFAQDMAAHHDQAILMARSLPAGADVETRVLARRIIDAQISEVATLRGWLTWFGEPLTSSTPMLWMPTGSAHRHGSTTGASAGEQPPMPGLASVAELTKLAGLTGADASIYFLQLMIRHHRGGVEMAQAAYDAPDASYPTKQLALSMITDQGTEIGQMTLLLAARGAHPLASTP